MAEPGLCTVSLGSTLQCLIISVIKKGADTAQKLPQTAQLCVPGLGEP